MAYEMIRFEVNDGVVILTLNRPERMNAWNVQMAQELSDAMVAANEDDSVRCVVVTGAGKAFCAGADLAAGGGTFADFSRDPSKPLPDRSRQVHPWEIDKPVIAAINGHAVGVGITYPMLCDIRIVAENAKIQFAFVRRGVIPELASHVTVARVVGLSNAADLLLSGRLLLGSEAAALGLASRALPADQVLPAAIERARQFKECAPVSVAISKRLLWEGLTKGIGEMRDREDPLFGWSAMQADAREGIAAFLEKRHPSWTLSAKRDKPEAFGFR